MDWISRRRKGLPIFVLGGGSNLLVADRGFHGLVLAGRPQGHDMGGRSTSGRSWRGLG